MNAFADRAVVRKSARSCFRVEGLTTAAHPNSIGSTQSLTPVDAGFGARTVEVKGKEA